MESKMDGTIIYNSLDSQIYIYTYLHMSDSTSFKCSVPTRIGFLELQDRLQNNKRRMEAYIKGVVKDCNKSIKQHLKFHEDEVREFKIEYTEQIITLFQQWDFDIKQLGDQEDKLTANFHQQQKTFQQARMIQNHNLKGLKQENEEFLKDLEDLEDGSLLTSVRNEIKKQMTLLQKKITGS
ncbi:Gm773 [Phodopus roborovskii]|uniref:Gm773 protein n=1 Tax=Phodopus roborovskii TaxID=109678 RepID=A0AAU9YZE8_PHORO|nr:Gm773 [Phodopus roborovskii]